MSAFEIRTNIVALMIEQHMTDRRLWEALGWAEHYFAAVLGGRGQLTGSQVAAIAAVLDVEPEDLTCRVKSRCIDCGVILPGTHRYNCPSLGPDLVLGNFAGARS